MGGFFSTQRQGSTWALLTELGNHLEILDKVFACLELLDVLTLSVCSQSSAGIIMKRSRIATILASHPRVSHLGHFSLSFSSNATTGILRRILCRIATGTEGLLSIDVTSGRVIMDIGSALNDENTHLASTVTAVPLTDDVDLADYDIQKYLEVSSYDEYDDFAPRHPLPKDRTHRRGDSLFNSDLESFAAEALAQDLQSIALKAINLEQIDVDSIPASQPRHQRNKKGLIGTVPSALQDLARDALNANSDDEKDGEQ